MPSTRHAWYSASMHERQAQLQAHVNYEDTGGEGREPTRTVTYTPDNVTIMPDGKIATLLTEGSEHGTGWMDIKHLGEYEYANWPRKPASLVPIQRQEQKS
jgi:hypothetical protein